MANRRFNQFFRTLHNYPVFLDCNFVVDATNPAGITSLKGPGIQNVFMHSTAAFTGTTHTSTSVTGISDTSGLAVGMPVQGSGIAAGTTIASIVSSTAITLSAATASSATISISYQAIGSPNPASGYAFIQLQDCYQKFFGGWGGVLAPNTGSDLTSVTAFTAYVITDLGTATTAEWVAKGLPVGITPAVGVAFIASATGTIGGSATVKVSSASGISGVEFIGSPNATIQSSAANVLGVSSGAYVIAKFVGPSVASVLTMDSYTPEGTNDSATPPIFTGTPAVLTGSIANTTSFAAVAPAAGSVCNINMYFSNTRITVQGE